jgi:DNA repair protein RecN (Recombination protein N)
MKRSRLNEITIRGIGVIDSASLEIGQGLTVLTGETGAGKTMVLTALNLVLGGKSDATLIRSGKDRLLASATFEIDDNQNEAIENAGGSVDGGVLILNRVVTSDGRSKASVNGEPITAGVADAIGSHLIEIHAQAANAGLLKPALQRELLDRFGGDALAKVLSDYSAAYRESKDLIDRYKAAKESASARDSQITQLQEFLSQFAKVKPNAGEFASLVGEIAKLDSVEEFRSATGIAQDAINDDESGAATLLNQARKALEGVAQKDPQLAALVGNLNEAFYLVNESARELESYAGDLEADPGKLNTLQLRRAELSAFIKRFGHETDPDLSLAGIIERHSGAKSELADLTGGDERLAQMAEEITAKLSVLKAKAAKLTAARMKSATVLAKEVSAEIHSLSMPHTDFLADVTPADLGEKIAFAKFHVDGIDEVNFSLTTSKSGSKVAINKGASGGELSRVMLAIEVVLAKISPVAIYVFDEVDAGVGGKAAIEVGRRLAALAESAQVIVVTHLPQVAAWAESHFVVEKNNDGAIVESGVRKLQGEERVGEIARMLAGMEESTSAQEHAAELLQLRFG